MTQRPAGHIAAALTTLLPRKRIRQLAQQSRVVQRRRKLDIVAFVYSLVLGFAAGERRTLSGLRREYLRATGVRLAPSSFYARFTPALTETMRSLMPEALAKARTQTTQARRRVQAFQGGARHRRGACYACHDALEPFYPSVWRHYMKASAKEDRQHKPPLIWVIISPVDRGPDFVRRVRSMGIEEVLIAPRSPWQNPYCERVIGTLRRECTDHLIVLGEEHLRASFFASTSTTIMVAEPICRSLRTAPETRATESAEEGEW